MTNSKKATEDIKVYTYVQEFESVFVKWINTISEITNRTIINIDGKIIRDSGDSNSSNSAIHIVSAYATKQKLCLAKEWSTRKKTR